MPLQNRVDPWGQLQAVTARGTLLGNRGILHNEKQEIIAQWKTKAWLTCRLVWKERKRTVMSPNSYTELFFLDEATALSAGHRPCAECRRARFQEFKSSWLAANSQLSASGLTPISEIDKVLHAERTVKGGKKVTYEEELEALPSGTMIGADGAAYLLWGKRLWQGSFTGYREVEEPPPPCKRVQVLTPASIVRMFRRGFQPELHDSARKAVAR